MFNSSKLVDGYALTSSVSNSYTTEWVDVRQWQELSASVVFTGGSPQGTAILEQSNDRQFTGGLSVKPLYAAGAENSSGAVKSVDDSSAVGTGYGANTVSVAGAGVYKLDQRLIPFGWARVKYTASSDVNTQLDIFLTLKNDK